MGEGGRSQELKEFWGEGTWMEGPLEALEENDTCAIPVVIIPPWGYGAGCEHSPECILGVGGPVYGYESPGVGCPMYIFG